MLTGPAGKQTVELILATLNVLEIFNLSLFWPRLILVPVKGCGKTACLTALCKELGFHIEEWINPVEQVGIFVGHKSIYRCLLKVDYGERFDEKWIPGDSIQYQVGYVKFTDEKN